jgi:hypothetical protein
VTLNDVHASTLLAGFVVDRDTQASQFSFEAERRLDGHWKTELDSRWFLNSGGNDVAAAFQDDSYVTVRLSRYF